MSSNKIKFKIVTLEKIVYAQLIDAVVIPTKAGQITVLPHHANLVSLIAPGEMIIRKDGEEISMLMTTGFFEVRPGSDVVIMADSADNFDEITIESIVEAKNRVEKMLKEKQNHSDIEFAHLEDVFARETTRLEIAQNFHLRRTIKN